MQKGRPGRDSIRSIPRPVVRGAKRSVSSDAGCFNRGSFLPRRNSSADRLAPNSDRKRFSRASPKVSFGLGNFSRNSLLDKKGIIKDPRPLTDKSYQKECVNALVDFLQECNYPLSISVNELILPSKKVFERIFQFLYNMYDPRYEAKKLEEEVPRIMKMFNYPFALNKSSFLTITHMVWPNLLGVLMYLMELAQVGISNDKFIFATDDFAKQEELNIKVNYVLDSFAAGQEDDADKDYQIFGTLAYKKGYELFNPEVLEKQIAFYEEDIEKKKADQAEYLYYVKKNESFKDEVTKHTEYIEKMDSLIPQKMEVLNELQTERTAKEKELNGLQKLHEDQQKILDSQGFDGVQFQKLHVSKKSNLVDMLHKKTERCKAEQQEYWNLEIEISTQVDKVKALCDEFNLLWPTLKRTLDSVMDSLKDYPIPAAVKLYKHYKVPLPDEIHLHPQSYEDILPVLNNAKTYLEKQQALAHNIVQMQARHVSELQIQLSRSEAERNLLAAQIAENEECLKIKANKNEHEAEAAKNNRKEQEEELAKVRMQHSELEKTIIEMRECVKAKQQGIQNFSASFKKNKETASFVLKKVDDSFADAIRQVEEMEKEANKDFERVTNVLMNL